jgi:hypothetical protein
MKIFLSYASERRAVADAIAVGLAQDGHEVFYDRDDLPAGDQYHGRIRDEVASADLFIFLVSPESVRQPSYALTEMGYARQRWPDPAGHVLPVEVATTPLDTVPPYLTANTLLQAKGNLVAEVLARVAEMDRRGGRRRNRRILAGAAIVALVVAAVVASRLFPSSGETCYVRAELRAREVGQAIPGGMVLDVSHAGTTKSFGVADDGSAPIDVGPLASDASWTVELRDANGAAAGSQNVRGCPRSPQTHELGRALELTLRPH